MNQKKAKALRQETRKMFGSLQNVKYTHLQNRPHFGEDGKYKGHINGTIVLASCARQMYQTTKKAL